MPTPHLRCAALLSTSLSFGCTTPTPSETQPPAPASADADASHWRYTITLDDALTRMQLQLCIDGPAPRRLEAGADAREFVLAARVHAGPPLRPEGEGFLVDGLGEQGCVDFEIDIAAACDSGERDSLRRGDTLLLSPDRWLWHPDRVPAQLDARARLQLPEGVAATLPWPHAEQGWRVLDRTSFGWNGWVAFGRYRPLVFTAAQARFEVALLSGERKASDAGIEAWLRTAAESSAVLHGRFPREHVAVVVIPTQSEWSDDPVLFGMARRGGGASAMLLLDAGASDDELLGEWVATHELLHLGMPLIADAWMSEGFVTYYTTILRARQGMLERDATLDAAAAHELQIRIALEALRKGFNRLPGHLLSLRAASDNMRALGVYTHVYWGGAAVAFDIDRALRAASDNRRSLDDLMRSLAPLAPERRRWSAADLLARMDEEIARWRADGLLDMEISAAAIAERVLESRGLPADLDNLSGLAVEFERGEARLLDEPLDEVRVRSGLFEPFAPSPRTSSNGS